jgi:glutaconate CoA-transferase subunit B
LDAQPARLPLTIGDPTIVTRATAVTSMFELFGYNLQGGLIDVVSLGAAQIDRHGNINTTVIGDYAQPKTRLPGSGGACEIALNVKHVFVIVRQSKRSFVDRLDFTTSVGDRVAVVVTDLGISTWPMASSNSTICTRVSAWSRCATRWAGSHGCPTHCPQRRHRRPTSSD